MRLQGHTLFPQEVEDSIATSLSNCKYAMSTNNVLMQRLSKLVNSPTTGLLTLGLSYGMETCGWGRSLTTPQPEDTTAKRLHTRTTWINSCNVATGNVPSTVLGGYSPVPDPAGSLPTNGIEKLALTLQQPSTTNTSSFFGDVSKALPEQLIQHIFHPYWCWITITWR